MKQEKPVGVVLLQLGGPDSLESVEPFLYNLFCDPDIIDLPLAFLFRERLAKFISAKRAPKVQDLYKHIGGKSPILKLTNRQARALELELRKSITAKVYVAMRYWHPLTDEVIEQIKADGVARVVLLPLYPHYSRSTTGSSVNEWNRVLKRLHCNGLQTSLVEHYCDHPLYIKALVNNINIALKRVEAPDRSKVHLVFSAHGTPMKLVKEGDPYSHHIRKTYQAVVEEGKFGLPHHLCFQSKVGPQKWLEPSLDGTIERLAAENVSHILVIPVAFVSDHIETLSEINMEGKQEAKEMGIWYFDMMPALHTNPLFIQALADVVLNEVNV
ncbi:MAG: ferrochelatase [Bacteroidetes bacterium]|nr:ferrochelatase [Bacteroidota bacterium]MCW5897133.1 ferrochelatase [Bacteroidota bacterium]